MRFLSVLVLSLLCLLPARAHAAGAFVTSVALEAVEQPESKTVVFTVEPDTAYPVLKKGGPGRAWCKVKSATGEGWVKCDGTADLPDKPRLSGEFLASRDRAPEAAPLPTQAPEATGCERQCTRPPLFRQAPPLTPVDREVLGLCPARPDAAVSSEDVRRFLSAHYDDARIQRALSVAGRPGARQTNVEWLTGLWVSNGPRNAFTHVFCGDDWTTRNIGGLHYLPRYAQLEAEGKLCFDGPGRGAQSLRGAQYVIRFRGVAPWSCAEKKLGGFPQKTDPVALVAIGTRAFARCCARGGAQKEGGVYSAPDLGNGAWRIWCGTRNGTYGIASLYPTEERPTCGE
ncbi:EndoU domain-containing protein [Melittangium boletus]|nr:EndoU domain-containing protein [Melittangium boletus]